LAGVVRPLASRAMTAEAEPADGPLRVERLDGERAGVVVLTLNLPERRNAMTAELTSAWQDAIAALAVDADVRAVVVTGAGGPPGRRERAGTSGEGVPTGPRA